VGTSRNPFEAELKPFVKTYEKIVLIPRPDYASRFSEFRKRSSLFTDAELCCRAKMNLVFFAFVFTITADNW